MAEGSESLDRLSELVPPPRSIERYGYAPDWGVLEEQLGLRLPSDFTALASRYGSGEFCDTAYLTAPRAAVDPRPHAPDASIFFERTLALLRDVSDLSSVNLWPQPGGVYPAMNLSTGGWMLWIADGPNPDEWEVAQTGVEMELEPLGCNLTTALVRWLDGELPDSLLGNPAFSEVPYFEPATGRERLRLTVPLDGQVAGIDDARARFEAAFDEDLRWWHWRSYDDRWKGAFDSPRTDLAVSFGGSRSGLTLRSRVVPVERAAFDDLIDRVAVAFEVDRSSITTDHE